MLRKLLSLLVFCSISFFAHSQADLKMAADTIISKSEFIGTTYLMNGKKLTLPVMEWFMQDYPSSFDAIQPAIVSDQLSVATYSVGSIFLIGGLFINDRDKRLSNNLIGLGGLTIGSGLLLQYISGRYQKRAIRLYNLEVKKKYSQPSRVNVDFALTPNGLGVQMHINKEQ